jgi:uncharacterized membrane protein
MISKPYLMVLAILVVWNILIFLTPFLEPPGLRSTAYSFFGYFCHQIPSRSISPSDLTLGTIHNFYEFPVCARDLAFYSFLMVGALAFPIFRKINSKEVPNIWFLIFSIIPMAIDGGTQLLGWRESTNLLRFLTGALAGFVCAYYLIPLVNIFVDMLKDERLIKWQKRKRKQKQKMKQKQ